MTVVSAVLMYRVTELKVRAAFAEEQIAIFYDMVSQARENPKGAQGARDYTANYYPSGTKQVAGSALDRIVEQSRAFALAEISKVERD